MPPGHVYIHNSAYIGSSTEASTSLLFISLSVCVFVWQFSVFTHTEGITFLGDRYEAFLQDMITKADYPVVILSHPNKGQHNVLAATTNIMRHVLIVLTGEESDKEVRRTTRKEKGNKALSTTKRVVTVNNKQQAGAGRTERET